MRKVSFGSSRYKLFFRLLALTAADEVKLLLSGILFFWPIGCLI